MHKCAKACFMFLCISIKDHRYNILIFFCRVSAIFSSKFFFPLLNLFSKMTLLSLHHGQLLRNFFLFLLNDEKIKKLSGPCCYEFACCCSLSRTSPCLHVSLPFATYELVRAGVRDMHLELTCIILNHYDHRSLC